MSDFLFWLCIGSLAAPAVVAGVIGIVETVKKEMEEMNDEQ